MFKNSLMLGLTAILIAGLAAFLVAWYQWLLARKKLRLALFERRSKVYDTTIHFVCQLVTSGEVDDSRLFQFNCATSDVESLFDQGVVEYISKIRKRAADMQLHQRDARRFPMDDKRWKHAQARVDQHLSLRKELTELETVFVPYFGFENIEGIFGHYGNEKTGNGSPDGSRTNPAARMSL